VKNRLVERLGAERAERVAERQRNLIVFPNLVVNDNIGLSIRTVYPTAPDRLTAYIWAFGTRDEDPLLRSAARQLSTFVAPVDSRHPTISGVRALPAQRSPGLERHLKGNGIR
jgi:hypothetical protein